MNEAELDSLLHSGAQRLRAAAALRWAIVVLGVAALMVAAGVFVWRMLYAVPVAELQRVQVSQAVWAILPFALAIVSFLAAFALLRPTASRVAVELDSGARLQDHILSWLQLRGQSLSGEAAEFRVAQSRATFQRAQGLSLKTLLPIRLPVWAPALWLALIGLCCALLVPPQVEVESKAAAREREQARRRNISAVVAEGSQQDAAANTPRVQTLSPTELLKLQLRVTDPNLSAEQRKQLLAEVEQKTGGIPENELTEDVRELLRELRGNAPDKTAETAKSSGSAQQSSNTDANSASTPVQGGANDVAMRERGIAAAERTFFDVKDELNRYYRGGAQK